MAEVKWIKITTDMLDDEKMKLIDTMPRRDLVHHIWIELLIYAGRTNNKGRIHISEGKGYSIDMLAVILRRPKKDIKYALKVLTDLELITVDENNIIFIKNFVKHQNIEGMERVRKLTRERVRRCRERKKLAEENEDVTEGSATVTEQKKEKQTKDRKKKSLKKKSDSDENMIYIRDLIEKREKEVMRDKGYSGETGGDMQKEHTKDSDREKDAFEEDLI